MFELEPRSRQVFELVHEFRELMVTKNPEALRPWLAKAMSTGIRPLRTFASGVHRDFEAVHAAITYPWSNGQTEGQVNRLKMLKRQMYGRAGIELLRKRFLAMPQQRPPSQIEVTKIRSVVFTKSTGEPTSN